MVSKFRGSEKNLKTVSTSAGTHCARLRANMAFSLSQHKIYDSTVSIDGLRYHHNGFDVIVFLRAVSFSENFQHLMQGISTSLHLLLL
ncbi:MAG: hypothetical protein KatS3mg110_2422 [Pirellulaceae bacterium]|nr:MAG: hypothetical protein KatS3mg110_2422 [Pirellulaceae bacterium]